MVGMIQDSQGMAQRERTSISAWPELMERLRDTAQALGIPTGQKQDRLGKVMHAAFLAFIKMKPKEQEDWLAEADKQRRRDQARHRANESVTRGASDAEDALGPAEQKRKRKQNPPGAA